MHRAHAVWRLLNKNSLQCFVFVAKSKHHLNSATFLHLGNTLMHVHGVHVGLR